MQKGPGFPGGHLWHASPNGRAAASSRGQRVSCPVHVSPAGVQSHSPRSVSAYSDTQKFVQNIDQHLLESITNSQKNSVFHEGFDSIVRFLNASTFYGLLTPCTNFGVWL